MLLCLPALLATQDDPARDALKRIDEVLGKARTVTLRSRTEAKSGGDSVIVTTTVLLKQDRVSISGSQTSPNGEQAFASIVEGGRLQVRFQGLRDEVVELPKSYPAEFRATLVRCGVFPISTLTHPKIAGDRVRTPASIIEVTELKLGEDSRSLTYGLKFHGIPALEAFGGAFACTLRFNPETGAMTSRTLTANAPDGRKVTISETYDLTLDAEIPDALLKMPERKRLSFKPTECSSSQCPVDPADAREGRWLTYRMQAGSSETRYTIRVVGKVEADWFIEGWVETDTMKYALLYRLGADGRIRRAWAAAEGDPAWTPIAVKEPPKPITEAPSLAKKESDEKKQVQGGTFDCKRIDVTLTIGGVEYKSSSWYSKAVWKFQGKDSPGGLVAMEASSANTVLEALGEDAKPTIPLPKEDRR